MPGFNDGPKSLTLIPKRFLTTAQLREATAGGDDYIRTKNNVVKGLAITRELNPDAPRAPGLSGVIAYGTGPRVKSRAQLFYESGVAVPTYVKQHTNKWEYIGKYRAVDLRNDPDSIRRYGKRRKYATAGALFIEPVEALSVEISGGGFADSKTRKEVEDAAVAYVTDQMTKEGFGVENHSKRNLGYDLLAISSAECLQIEVKGTNCSEPHFFLTRRELRCAKREIGWRLFVVCNARTTPTLTRYTAAEMEAQFDFDALAWECTAAT